LLVLTTGSCSVHPENGIEEADGSIPFSSTNSFRSGAAFTDRGKVIDIHDSQGRVSVLAALQLSAQTWGSFTVHGNEHFRRLCVELAVEHGFKIANPDLQQALAGRS
jgi:hypothetical protein